MSAASIDKLLEHLLIEEGVYDNNPKDTGGETKYGVTAKVARDNGYVGSMKDMPKALALEIYKKKYWIAPGFDRIAAVAPRVAAEMFDCGVNMGQGTAVKFLQRALNAFNREQKLYKDLIVDGQSGPTTVNTLKEYLKDRGSNSETVLLKAMVSLRGARYIELAETRQANEEFVYGWIANRVDLPQ